jgi:hypothetical protein
MAFLLACKNLKKSAYNFGVIAYINIILPTTGLTVVQK